MSLTLRASLPDRQTLLQLADWLALGVVLSLPWSTTATGILIALWLLAFLPAITVQALREELATAAGGLPVLLWLFAAVGMFWAGVSWAERLDGLDGFHRLLVIPLLLAQFRRSERGALVLYGFLFSATCLLVLSWAFVLLGVTIYAKSFGVPVKNQIFQCAVFLVCAFALIGAAFDLWRAQQRRMAAALGVLAALFLADIAFVATSRTALVVAPVLVVALGYRQLGGKGVVAAALIAAVLGGLIWSTSPYLRERVMHSVEDLRAYMTSDTVTSTAQHLEFLKKSWKIVTDAPLIGHGTGSIADEFRRVKVGETGIAAQAPGNPHNQFFAVAIQLGLLGGAVLLAMWTAHFMLFRGGSLVAWIGAIMVLQNVASSLFNSHLFDFTEGWFYVFGVGVAGGMMLNKQPGLALLRR